MHISSLGVLFLFAPPALPPPVLDELIHADGRRETVEDPRKDSKGQWSGTRDGHRSFLRPGEIVAIVSAKGVETVILPDLIDAPNPPDFAVAIASLQDPKSESWRQLFEPLGVRPTRGMNDALVLLTKDKVKSARVRAIAALCMLYTKASVLAATDAVLAEKDVGARREAASALFSVEEIFRRCDTHAALERGLADPDVDVRLDFAMLSPRDHAVATTLLRESGITHHDHHVRESAAYELGVRGDGAGESILIGMLARTRLPGMDERDEELMLRLLSEEQVRVCAVLGKLGTKNARAALERALKSPQDAVSKAARAALDAAEAK